MDIILKRSTKDNEIKPFDLKGLVTYIDMGLSVTNYNIYLRFDDQWCIILDRKNRSIIIFGCNSYNTNTFSLYSQYKDVLVAQIKDISEIFYVHNILLNNTIDFRDVEINLLEV